MYQIIIGKTSFNGSPVKSYFNRSMEGEVINFTELSEAIVEGLRANMDLIVDSAIIDSLATSGLTTIYDLISLQYTLNKQGINLIVTRVNTDIIDVNTSILVKVITPVNDISGIKKSVDFSYSNRIEFDDIINSITQTYDLFNPSIFINSPISEIMAQLPQLESAGIPDGNLIEEGLGILREMGFDIEVIYFND